MVSTLWVTSVNKQLWDVSGHKLVETWLQTGTCGDMLVSHEGMTPSEIPERCLTHDLDKDDYLQNWLHENRSRIPESLGGEAKPCDCPGGDDLSPATEHAKQGCHWTWWNRNASKWFRKIATLRVAMKRGYQSVVWIDCDCYFTKEVCDVFVRGLFDGADVFYMKGRHRKVPEGGIVGYALDRHGEAFYREVKDHYDSHQYCRLDRWDDSFIVWKVIQDWRSHACLETGLPYCHDIVCDKDSHDGHVVKRSLLKNHIVHEKGKHGRVMRIGA